MGGELRPDKCSHTVHEMKPTKNDGWEYVKAIPEKLATKETTDTDELQPAVDDLWKDINADELDKLLYGVFWKLVKRNRKVITFRITRHGVLYVCIPALKRYVSRF